jgi:hypothetical protein
MQQLSLANEQRDRSTVYLSLSCLCTCSPHHAQHLSFILLLVLLVSVSAPTSAMVVVVPFLTRFLPILYILYEAEAYSEKGGMMRLLLLLQTGRTASFILKKRKKKSLCVLFYFYLWREVPWERGERTSFSLIIIVIILAWAFLLVLPSLFRRPYYIYSSWLVLLLLPSRWFQSIPIKINKKTFHHSSSVEAVSSLFAIF